MNRSFAGLRRRRSILAAVAVLMTAAALQFFDVNPAASQSANLPAYDASSDPGLDPDSAVWKEATPIRLPLSAQSGAYAAGGGGVDQVTAKALHYGTQIFIRIEWNDATKDDSTTRVQDFSDAVAVEFPAGGKATIPSICMGQADAAVNIWQWRADTQAGFGDPAQKYVNAEIDGYPSKDPLWYPGRFLKNPVSNPDQGPVQTLVAQAFGTLSPANNQDVQGNGKYADGKWAVVFKRQFLGADAMQATFSAGNSSDMAFAVWNGSDGDRNGRKSVSQFARLSVQSAEAPGVTHSNAFAITAAAALLVGFTGLGLLLAYGGTRIGTGGKR